jgi:RNA polymerase sigma-70 factor (ECF subfamily)
MNEQSDSDLMAMYARGNAEAFDALFGRWEDRLLGFFVKRARSEEHAADLFQELFLRLHRFREQFDARQPFGPWVWQIARRVWIDDLRRSHGMPFVELAEAEDIPLADELEAETLARDEVRHLLGALAPEQQMVTVAAHALDMGYGEIAQGLGKSVAAAKQIGSRAMRRLRRVAGPCG